MLQNRRQGLPWYGAQLEEEEEEEEEENPHFPQFPRLYPVYHHYSLPGLSDVNGRCDSQ